MSTAHDIRKDSVLDVTTVGEAMHVSWVSGVPYAYALRRHGLRVGNEEYVRDAEAVLDFVAENLTPGGPYYLPAVSVGDHVI